MPDLIPDKEYYMYKALSDNNFEFLFQIDESGYPDDLIIGNTPFNFGSLYIYAETTDSKFINPIAVFLTQSLKSSEEPQERVIIHLPLSHIHRLCTIFAGEKIILSK